MKSVLVWGVATLYHISEITQQNPPESYSLVVGLPVDAYLKARKTTVLLRIRFPGLPKWWSALVSTVM